MAYCREMGSCRGGVLRRSFLRSRNRDPPWASLQARLAVLMRLTLLATLALIALRVVIGLHFFLEGSSHLQDPQWSSLGFRRAAVGPLADFYRKSIPEPGNFSGTVAALDDRPTDEVIAAWEANVAADWEKRLAIRQPVLAADDVAAAAEAAKAALESTRAEWKAYLDEVRPDIEDYRGELARLAAMRRSGGAEEIPYVIDRIRDKQRELAGQAALWKSDAEAFGDRVVGRFADALSPASRTAVAAVVDRTDLWKADQFVSWSLVTIGGCLVIGFLTKFNAMGGVIFLASVVATQPFWVPGAQTTYEQWVEMAGLLVLASMPCGGWMGFDYFLSPLKRRCCPLSKDSR
jgi:uncharacterized membrane protein YphA (DoxX/SURF4 family)